MNRKISKILTILLVLMFSLVITGCRDKDPKTSKFTEVTNFDVPEFSIKFNGVTINKEKMSSYKIYEATVTTTNTSGTTETFVYTGYKMSDVIAASGITGTVTSCVTVSGTYEGLINSENVSKLEDAMLALKKVKTDGSETYDDLLPWFAPISSSESPDYTKLLDCIYYNGMSGENKEVGQAAKGENELKTKDFDLSNLTFSMTVNDTTKNKDDFTSLQGYKATVYVQNKSKSSTFTYKLSGFLLKDVLKDVFNLDISKVESITITDGSKTNTYNISDINLSKTMLAFEVEEITPGSEQARVVRYCYAPIESQMRSDYFFDFTSITVTYSSID